MTGVSVGIGVIVATVGTLSLMGAYTLTEVSWSRGIVTGALLGLGAAFGEEVAIRGILLRLLMAQWGPMSAIITTSVVFGALHLTNPHATFLGALGTGVQAGVLLGLASLLTRRLWLAVGVHAGLNFAQSGLFGLPVSGTAVEPGVFSGVLHGPAWLSGGATGLEGSIVMLLITSAACAFLGKRIHTATRDQR